MSIPRAVQEQADRAEAILNGTRNVPAAPPAQPASAAPTPASPAPTGDSPPATPASAPVPPDAEHRFQVLQGKYNAEVPRLHATLSQKDAELARAQQQLAELQEQLKAVPAKSLVSPEEVEEHGENLIDVIRRAAREELGGRDKQIEALQGEIAQLRGGVGQMRQKSFLEVLTQTVSDWAVINDDASFHGWLGEIDPLSGRRRQDLLSEAHAAEDGARAAAIFTTFKKDRDSWAARSESALSGQIVPAAGSAGGNPTGVTNPGARQWTRAEVNQVYAAIRTGRLKGDEAVAAEAEIQLAMQENRIR